MSQTTCRHCPAGLHRVAIPGDEWGWADETGARYGTDRDLLHVRPSPAGLTAGFGDSPDGRLAELRAAMGAVKTTKRADLTWVYWAYAREYSALKVRLETGGTFHEHYPAEQPAYDGPPPPVCCGWPMRLAPSGWRCRQDCGEEAK